MGPRFAATLEKLGIATAEDLIFHFPHRYEDRSHFRPLGQVGAGETVCTSGRVLGAALERTARRGLFISKVVINDASGSAELVFFNQSWIPNVFNRIKGKRISIFGQATRNGGVLQFTHPEWEELTEEEDSLHLNRIVPIHPATDGITTKQVRTIIAHALEMCAEEVPDLLPPELRQRLRLIPAREAIRQIHFPEDMPRLEAARQRLVFDELFQLQAALALRKRSATEMLPGIAFDVKPEYLDDLKSSLPFELTGAQQRVIAEIQGDMAVPRPMNRLLQGDVGSGKTVVAAAAVLTAVRSGYQVAMMVPTEILAEQHYAVVRRLLEPLGVRIHRLVGSVRAKGKRLIKEEIASGEVDLIVGTHALLQEDVEFHNQGLAIIDEQHRFGVLQRLSLVDKATGGCAPDILVMTATPIPRTLALTVYGDLDVSIIDELPPNRKPVKTHWRRKDQRDTVYKGVRRLVEEGRQVYCLCPLVEESDKLQARAASEMYERLQEVFPELRIGLIHGQLPSHEKDEVMDRFREGEIDILVATVVIEVGVDVPNACCMVIEDAERFGLAQLHQLRGRVGRGEWQSFCVLMADPKTDEGRQRIEAMVQTNDGFEIAEQDLRLRGPGEFYGTKQSGILNLRIANIVGDHAILQLARSEAFQLVEADPELEHPDNRALGESIRSRYAELILATVA